MTEEGKLFQKNGINPEVLYLQTTLGQTAMIAGEIQMCVYSASLLAPARLQGADVVMVTSFLNKPIYRLVVCPEIRTVADLKGRTIGHHPVWNGDGLDYTTFGLAGKGSTRKRT